MPMQDAAEPPAPLTGDGPRRNHRCLHGGSAEREAQPVPQYPLSGSCFCGAVRYTLTAPPMFVHCCHCRDCQKQSGGAFAINGIVESEHVVIVAGSAAPVAVTVPTDSGSPHDIYRCPACQSAVWSDYGRRRVMLFVRLSTLDEAHAFVPDVHIFTRSKVPWVVLPAGSRTFEVYYDMKREWPAESLARREAILGAE